MLSTSSLIAYRLPFELRTNDSSSSNDLEKLQVDIHHLLLGNRDDDHLHYSCCPLRVANLGMGMGPDHSSRFERRMSYSPSRESDFIESLSGGKISDPSSRSCSTLG